LKMRGRLPVKVGVIARFLARGVLVVEIALVVVVVIGKIIVRLVFLFRLFKLFFADSHFVFPFRISGGGHFHQVNSVFCFEGKNKAGFVFSVLNARDTGLIAIWVLFLNERKQIVGQRF